MTEGEGEVWPRVVKLGDCGLPQVDGFFRGIGLEQKVVGLGGLKVAGINGEGSVV